MTICEKDIMHENGMFWVLRTNTGYTVCEDGVTHSTTCGTEWPLDDDGLSIAKAYCDGRAKRSVSKGVYSPMQDTYGQSVCVSSDCFSLGE